MGAAADPGSGTPRATPRSGPARPSTTAQLLRYALVGGGATALNAVLFLVLRIVLDTFTANITALVLSTAASTEASRRFAFGGARAHRLREWVQDAGTVAFYAGYTSVVLVVLHALVDSPTAGEEAIAVAVASLAGGLLRYAVLRFWVFETSHGGGAAAHGEDGVPWSTTSPRST